MTFLRTILYSVALLVGLGASIIVVRKLPPWEYAFYQLVNKRFSLYVAVPVIILGYWAYRYAAEGRRGAVYCYYKISILYSLAVAPLIALIALKLDVPLNLLLPVVLFLSLRPVWVSLRTLLTALRPVRYSVAELTYRSLYGVLVIALVYFLRLGCMGAFVSITVALLAIILFSRRWLSSYMYVDVCGKLTVEWLKASYIPVIAQLASLVFWLDAVIAYSLRGSTLVAGYFAISSLLMLISEPVRVGLSYLAAHMLSTRDRVAYMLAIKTVMFLTAPIVAVAIVYPKHIIYLLNPAYDWATPGIWVLSIATLLSIMATGFAQVYQGVFSGGVGAAKHLLKLHVGHLLASLGYMLAITVGLYLIKENSLAIVVWGLAFLIKTLLEIAVPLMLLPSLRNVFARLTGWLLLYTVVAIASALLVRPSVPPSHSFWETARDLAPTIVATFIVYATIIIIVDKQVRSLLKQLIAGVNTLF